MLEGILSHPFCTVRQGLTQERGRRSGSKANTGEDIDPGDSDGGVHRHGGMCDQLSVEWTPPLLVVVAHACGVDDRWDSGHHLYRPGRKAGAQRPGRLRRALVGLEPRDIEKCRVRIYASTDTAISVV